MGGAGMSIHRCDRQSPPRPPSRFHLRRRGNHLVRFQLAQLGRDDHPAVTGIGIVVEILLMIAFSRVKLLERDNLGDNRVPKILLGRPSWILPRSFFAARCGTK